MLDDGRLPIAGTSAALPAMVDLLEAFRAAGRPIVHIVRIYEPDGSNAEPCRRALFEAGKAALARGDNGCQLAPVLHPGASLNEDLLLGGGIQQLDEHEAVIYKPRWGAFYNTPLEQHLRAHRVDTLVFAGCNFPNCPRTSIYEASERDFRIVLATDAISGLYDRGRRELEGIGVVLMPAAEIAQAVAQIRVAA